jgi:hypothetical protein
MEERLARIEAKLNHIVNAIEMLSDAVNELDSRTYGNEDYRTEWLELPGNLTTDNPHWPTSYKVHCCDDCGAKWRSDHNGDICHCGKSAIGPKEEGPKIGPLSDDGIEGLDDPDNTGLRNCKW